MIKALPKLTAYLVLLLMLQFCAASSVNAQMYVKGTVYDSTKLYGVTGVVITSSSGTSTVSDSIGGYSLLVQPADSVTFFYNNKPTMKFTVAKMENPEAFDISLRVKLTSKYKPLKEIQVFSKTYSQQVQENREAYAKVFNFKGGGLVSTSNPNSPPGLDLGQLIGIFQFRKNKQMKNFRNRLLAQEEERYIDYRFNTRLLKRITRLEGDSLRVYQRLYRPDFDSLVEADDVTLYTYIIRTAAEFRRREH
jgi:hypothetical protein